MLEFVLDKLMLADENFTSYMEENFSNWDDDGEMVIQLLVNLLQKPGSADFKEMISSEKKDFAVNLLKTALEKSEYLQLGKFFQHKRDFFNRLPLIRI